MKLAEKLEFIKKSVQAHVNVCLAEAWTVMNAGIVCITMLVVIRSIIGPVHPSPVERGLPDKKAETPKPIQQLTEDGIPLPNGFLPIGHYEKDRDGKNRFVQDEITTLDGVTLRRNPGGGRWTEQRSMRPAEAEAFYRGPRDE